MARHTACIPLLVALSLTLTGAKAESGDAPVKRTRTKSGLTIIVKPNTWNRIISVSVLVSAGSRFDPPRERGLANLTGNLLLGGTESRSAMEIAETADGSGIQMGTVTSVDYTEIYVTSVDKYIDTALDLLADVLAHPTFDEGRLAEEKRVANERLARELDSSFNRAHMRVNKLMFKGHPYAFSVVGTKSGIDAVTRSDVVDFYSDYYVTEGTVVSAVGNFDVDEMADKLARRLSEYPRGETRAPEPMPLPRSGPKRAEFFRDTSRGYLQVGFLAPSVLDDDVATVAVLDALMGSGLSSRLFLALGNEGAGIADIAGSFLATRSDQGQYVIFASTNELEPALRIVESEIENLKNEPVSEEELSRAKHRVIADLTLGKQTNRDQALLLGWGALLGLGDDFLEEHREDVKRVEAEDLTKAAQKYLVDPVTVLLRPGVEAKTGI